MIYYLVIIILFSFSIISEAKLSNYSKYFLFAFIAILLILLAGLRGNIEGDYLAYQDIFNASRYDYSAFLGIEPGYFYFNKCIQYLGLPFQVIVFTVAVFSILPKLSFFYSNSLNFAFSSLILYCTSFFIFDFIQIRQAIAIALFMFSIKYIYTNQLLKYIVIIVIAMMFHISAVILLPGYFIFNKRYPKSLLLLTIVVCAFFNVFKISIPFLSILLENFSLPSISEAKMSIYSQSDNFSNISLKQFILGFIFIHIRDKKFNKSEYLNMLVNLFILGLLISTIFNGVSELAFRIKWYFFWTEALLILYIIHYISLKKLFLRISLYFLFACLYTASLSSMLNEFAFRGDYIFPYRTFWQL